MGPQYNTEYQVTSVPAPVVVNRAGYTYQYVVALRIYMDISIVSAAVHTVLILISHFFVASKETVSPRAVYGEIKKPASSSIRLSSLW